MEQTLISQETLDAPDKRLSFGNYLETDKPKLVGIYFSMHNCPPCREFTPMLACLYEEVNEDQKQLEVVFLSGDKTDDEFKEYYSEMPWLALPRDQKSIVMNIAKRFQIKGVPRLIMIRASDGKVLSEQCYEKVRD